METQTNSFIPHETSFPKNRFTNIGIIFCIILFIASGAIAGFSYLLRKKEEVKTVSYEDVLSRSRERFSTGLPIYTLQEFDSRLRTAKDLLSGHKSLTGLFKLIERITLKNVQFTSMSYSANDGVVILKGRAPDYATVAEQNEQFSIDSDARRYVTGVLFSNLSVDTKGQRMVNFEISFKIDPEFLLYNRYLLIPTQTESSSVNNINIKNQ